MQTPRAVPQDLEAVLATVQRIDVASRRAVTEAMTGSYRSVFRGAGIEFETVRAYEPGDEPRTMDWNVTARVGQPYVKTFVDERQRTVLFALDTSPSMAASTGAYTPREVAAHLVASVGLSAAQVGDKLGLVAFDADGLHRVRSRTGRRHGLRLVRDCLAHPTAEGPGVLAPVLDHLARTGRRSSVVFVLSDFHGDGWTRALQAANRRHDVIAVWIRDPAETLPRVGMWRARDPETGDEVLLDTSSRRVRAAWEARIHAWQRRVEHAFRRARVGLLEIPIPKAAARDVATRPLRAFLHARALARESR